MKASELVEKLNKLIEKHGDQPVFVDDAEEVVFQPVFSVVVGMSEDKRPFQFLIADKETTQSFI